MELAWIWASGNHERLLGYTEALNATKDTACNRSAGADQYDDSRCRHTRFVDWYVESLKNINLQL
jgi:hypothetical protein